MENTDKKLTIDEIIKKLCIPDGNVVKVFLSSEVKKCMEYYLNQEMKEKDEVISNITKELDEIKLEKQIRNGWSKPSQSIFKALNSVNDDLIKENKTLEAQIRIIKLKHLSETMKMADALKKYGKCKCRWTPEHGYKCTCGFAELVSEFEKNIERK